ncbi:MAG: hypothetical protein ABJM73_00020 [Parasphingorhabdus sp.]|uniref:hypothetical protein n=1 Tax=Parasphingorhabdus sp. TaxID=2709688 RepID=UPI003298E094
MSGWANAGTNKNGCGEKSGKSGDDLVLDVCVRHFDFLLVSNLGFAVVVSEDVHSFAQAVPVLIYLYISMIW